MACSSSPSPAAVQLASQVAQATGVDLVACDSGPGCGALTVESFRLGNGLVVLLASDRRAPVFAYQTWFQVGSRDEDPERTGLAHLFEHLMFKGTRKHPSGTFDAEMERRGAQTNAATWVDWTYYMQALAARGDNLETIVGFEADRMHNLILDQETFASELEVVKNERRMAVDNAIVGQLSEALFSLVFTAHPYRWPTIGSMAHLEASTLDDLRAFYRRHYAPNRATVVVCGDIDRRRSLTAIARAYGPIAAAPEPAAREGSEPAQAAPRLTVLERPVLAPQLVMGFRAPAEGTREHAALEMVLSLLTDGDTAFLYDALVTEAKLASEVSGFLTPFREPGLCELHVVGNAGVDIEPLLGRARRVLRALADHIDEAGRQKAHNQLLFAYYDGMRDVESVAEALGHHQSNAGRWQGAFELPARLAQVTVADMKAVARATFAEHAENVVAAVAPT